MASGIVLGQPLEPIGLVEPGEMKAFPIDTERNRQINEREEDLEFDDLPPFPCDLETAPLLRICLQKLLSGDPVELDRLWKACCELGFFYLDLRAGHNSHIPRGDKIGLEEQRNLTENPWDDEAGDRETKNEHPDPLMVDVKIDGDQLLKDAYSLFDVGRQIFDLPVAEKIRYDLKDQNSYFGYKGYGGGVIDSNGTPDRNEFYNVSKDDIFNISPRLPAPSLLEEHRSLLCSFIQNSHAIVSTILRLLNARLDLPPETLPSLHKLHAASGDQVRWVKAPSQPQEDRHLAVGEHTDFGSVTLLFNRLGGLQILPPGNDAQWCFVKPLNGHAVVNLGDAMVKFTSGVLRSNIHRVVNPPGEQSQHDRMSLVYFARPEDDILLKALDGSKMIDDRKKKNEVGEEAFTSKDWILKRALGRRQGGDWAGSAGTEGDRLPN